MLLYEWLSLCSVISQLYGVEKLVSDSYYNRQATLRIRRMRRSLLLTMAYCCLHAVENELVHIIVIADGV